MKETRELICITCPMGCGLTVTLEDGAVTGVTGNSCKRGLAYAQAEAVAPTRMLTTTVRVRGGQAPLVPVKTMEPIPKEQMMAAMAVLDQVVVDAPVAQGNVILMNLLGCGVDVVATGQVL